MTHFRRAVGCIAVLIFSTMFINDVLAGSIIGDGQINRVRQHFSNEQQHTDDGEIEASAGPVTPTVRIVQVRPHISKDANAGTVFIEVDQSSICNTSIYSIDMSRGGSKEAYATALAAFIVDKPVVIELVNSGCAGAGTKIQSVFLNR